MDEKRPKHSFVGASAAERFMNCPGSVSLIQSLPRSDGDEEEDFAAEGTAAHAALAECQIKGLEAWEIVGQAYNGIEASVEMALAVHDFLNEVTGKYREPCHTVLVEHPIQFKADPRAYGTLDRAAIGATTVYIDDFKYGVGIAVDAHQNSQLMYYAWGVLQDHPDINQVQLTIIQPRAFHPFGPIRRWTTTRDFIASWINDKLLPAIERAHQSPDVKPGEWCRFCPAKLICPALSGAFGAAARQSSAGIPNDPTGRLARDYAMIPQVRSYIKALEKEVYQRLMSRQQVPGVKLVRGKTDRIWKEGAEEVFNNCYLENAYKPKELKSPAQMEKIDSDAKALVREYAYQPQGGLTIALEDDPRSEVKITSAEETFAPLLAKEAAE